MLRYENSDCGDNQDVIPNPISTEVPNLYSKAMCSKCHLQEVLISSIIGQQNTFCDSCQEKEMQLIDDCASKIMILDQLVEKEDTSNCPTGT
jgi:hypothetical protein